MRSPIPAVPLILLALASAGAPAARAQEEPPPRRVLLLGIDGADAAVFERLRAERLSIAKELDVPPYVVFPDATLIALAKERPGDWDELLDIPGIGQSKRERFGKQFLAVIEDYVEGA